jgi:hypothetical protein
MLDPIFNHIGVSCQDTTAGWLHSWTADFGANGRRGSVRSPTDFSR